MLASGLWLLLLVFNSWGEGGRLTRVTFWLTPGACLLAPKDYEFIKV
ncbi:hypothetical protein K9N68_00645 [Kovacikia minuta CCNUW1]|nr:hypothetical protein [Kovacikia minuta]UBF26557.1 hypothetical protein K9N68_00645 [Kovacikia minuta CCNUW1]